MVRENNIEISVVERGQDVVILLYTYNAPVATRTVVVVTIQAISTCFSNFLKFM